MLQISANRVLLSPAVLLSSVKQRGWARTFNLLTGLGNSFYIGSFFWRYALNGTTSMLATMPDNWDVDLSHLPVKVAYAISPEVSLATKRSPLYLIIGLLVSCAIHASMLLIHWQQNIAALKKPESITLRVQLQMLAKPEPIIEQAPLPLPNNQRGEKPILRNAPAPQESISTSNLPADVAVPEPQKPEIKAPVLQRLTAEELRDIIQTSNNIQKTAPTTGIATNVFHPALRQALQEEERKPELRRADAGPKTHMDPSGATIVDLGGGKCLRSSVPTAGEAQNWYMTSCGGKSESEEMLQRVNQAVKGKLQFEDQ
uniref:hypothetical protein n=1 Tax=Cellvibrio fontiphilus TaxID=1815559 RepID=UPI002B4BD319|nr:hypothetical protein [Cellvibrio fontiphilus]